MNHRTAPRRGEAGEQAHVLAALQRLLQQRLRRVEQAGDRGGAERLKTRLERVAHLLGDLARREMKTG